MKALNVVVVLGLIFSVSTFSQETSAYHLADFSGLDFAAPAVPAAPSIGVVPDLRVGTIVYDESTDQFKGLNASGTWDPMTVPGGSANITSSSAGRYHVETASLSQTGSCAINSQSGSWVASGVNNTTGDCTWTIASGEFSSAPNCTCSPGNTGTGVTCISRTSRTSTSIRLAVISVGGNNVADTDVQVICMGSH